MVFANPMENDIAKLFWSKILPEKLKLKFNFTDIVHYNYIFEKGLFNNLCYNCGVRIKKSDDFVACKLFKPFTFTDFVDVSIKTKFMKFSTLKINFNSPFISRQSIIEKCILYEIKYRTLN